MTFLSWNGKAGVTKLHPHEPNSFSVVKGIKIPKSPFYIMFDVDRGDDTRNIAPSKAEEIIINKQRLPLTIDEGVALVTHFPEFLIKNHCFSLLASRAADKRVPAIWINTKQQPNLGWCWYGNPHTWLGCASCKIRV